MQEVIKVNIEDANGELVVRTGPATENFRVRKGIEISGTIGVPLAHLEKPTYTNFGFNDDFSKEALMAGKSDVIEESFLTIDRNKMQIAFIENAGKDCESRYTGSLSLD